MATSRPISVVMNVEPSAGLMIMGATCIGSSEAGSSTRTTTYVVSSASERVMFAEQIQNWGNDNIVFKTFFTRM